MGGDSMPEEPGIRIIEEDEIPSSYSSLSSELLEVIKAIPQGKAWAATEEDLAKFGVTIHIVRISVKRYVKRNLLPKSFKTTRRTQNGKVTLYIMNLRADPEKS
jgi:hypothetical protein